MSEDCPDALCPTPDTLNVPTCCRLVEFPVGILTPDWLANATYLGTETVDAKPCHVWTKTDGFIKYWADQDSGDPVRWIFFDGVQVRSCSPWSAITYQSANACTWTSLTACMQWQSAGVKNSRALPLNDSRAMFGMIASRSALLWPAALTLCAELFRVGMHALAGRAWLDHHCLAGDISVDWLDQCVLLHVFSRQSLCESGPGGTLYAGRLV